MGELVEIVIELGKPPDGCRYDTYLEVFSWPKGELLLKGTALFYIILLYKVLYLLVLIEID